MSLPQIAQILEDLFGITAASVELSDDLRDDWGIDANERHAFDCEFCAEFDVQVTGKERTVEDYARLAESE